MAGNDSDPGVVSWGWQRPLDHLDGVARPSRPNSPRDLCCRALASPSDFGVR